MTLGYKTLRWVGLGGEILEGDYSGVPLFFEPQEEYVKHRRVYVACSLSRANEAQAMAGLLEEHHHQVVSTWHTPGVLETIMNTDSLKQQGDGEEAVRDFHEVCASDLLIVMAMPNGVAFYGGGHVCEFGIALGRSIETIVVGDKSNVFYHLPWVKVVATKEEAVKWAGRS